MSGSKGDGNLPELPEGWDWRALGNVAEVIRGVTYKKDQVGAPEAAGHIPLLRATNIAEAGLVLQDFVWIPQDLVKERQMLREGDLVVAASSGSPSVVGKAAQVDGQFEGTFGAFCSAVRPEPSLVDPRFLRWVMASDGYRRRVSSLAAGSNINNLKRAHLLETLVPMPPLEEQERIGERVSALISVCDKGNRELNVASSSGHRYRKSRLCRAFDGTITAPLAEIAQIRSGLTKGRKTRAPTTEIAFLRAANVRGGALDLKEIKTIPATDRECERFKLEPGDVLMVEGSGSPGRLGQGWVWEGQVESCLHQNHVFCARPDTERCLPRYLAWFIQSPAAKDYFRTVAKTTSGLTTLNKREMSALPVPLPAVDEQRKVVDQLERMAFELGRVETAIGEGAVRSRALRSAVVTAALTGGVVRPRRRGKSPRQSRVA